MPIIETRIAQFCVIENFRNLDVLTKMQAQINPTKFIPVPSTVFEINVKTRKKNMAAILYIQHCYCGQDRMTS